MLVSLGCICRSDNNIIFLKLFCLVYTALCSNCVCMILTLAYIMCISRANRTVYNDTHVEFDEDQRQQLFHCPVPSSTVYSQGHRFTKDLIQLVTCCFMCSSCVCACQTL